MKYIRTIEVEAVQYNGSNERELKKLAGNKLIGSEDPVDKTLYLELPRGLLTVNLNDIIAQDSNMSLEVYTEESFRSLFVKKVSKRTYKRLGELVTIVGYNGYNKDIVELVLERAVTEVEVPGLQVKDLVAHTFKGGEPVHQTDYIVKHSSGFETVITNSEFFRTCKEVGPQTSC